MYNPMYEGLLTREELEIDDLPTRFIRKIKGLDAQIQMTKNMSPDDNRYRAVVQKDHEVCDMIVDWLDEEPEASSQTTPPAKTEETPVEVVAEKVETPDDSNIVATIQSNLNGKRIHENQLTQILGKKPASMVKLNGMTLKRVFLGNGVYEVC